jgi:hypothetical protein
MVLTLVNDGCDMDVSCEEIELALCSDTGCVMKASHGTWGKEPAPERYATEWSSSEVRSGEYRGSDPSPSGPWPVMAAAALCWKSVINMAAVSRSTIPSLLASICSNVAASIVIDGFEGPASGDVFCPPFRLPSPLLSGMPPSFAWTVRSCRRSRSRRTKVLRHFMHLKGLSLVSVCTKLLAACLTKPPPRRAPQRTQAAGNPPRDKNIRINLRDLSCLLRCSLRLKARLQNWHLYFFSGTEVDFRTGEVAVEAVEVAMSAPGIVAGDGYCRLI